MKYLFVILVAAIGLFSCEDIVTEVDLPKEESRVVVSSFISPTDTLVSVYLLKSSPLFSDQEYDDVYYDDYYQNEKVIRDAQVLLSKANSPAVALVFDEEKGSYTIDAKLFPIEYGQTYTLKVITKEGKEVTAATTIPTAYFSEIDMKVNKVDSNSDNETYNVSVSWIDEKEIENYYSVAYEHCSEYGCNNYYVDDRLNLLLADEGKDGQRLGVNNSELHDYRYYGGSDENETNELVVVKLAKTYYDFLRYSYTYEENPFSEPSSEVTNIEGGLGVFVGYVTFRKELVLE